MNIELKDAAQQALKELGEARKIIRASSSRQRAKDWDRRATDALANIRTAIQQAEAQQPATPEPVKAERDQLRCAQADAVIPLIGPLLDAWENADREVISQEPELSRQLKAINNAMEGAQPATGEPVACQGCGDDATHEAGSDETSFPGAYCDNCGPRAAATTPVQEQARSATTEPVVEPFVATYSSESIGGKQHDTGRVNKGPRGGFFASTASVEDASLIADALNAYTRPAPSVPDDAVREADRYRFILAAADDMTTSRYKSLCELLGVAITEDFDLGAAIDAAMLAAK